MKNIIIILVLSVTLTSCGVSRVLSENWYPATTSRDNQFYDCLRKSKNYRPLALYGSARSGEETNPRMLAACMRSKGYQLREITGGEMVWSLITSPLAIGVTLLGASPEDFY